MLNVLVGEGDQPLLDVKFPDVSQPGQGVHLANYEPWTSYVKLTLWHSLASVRQRRSSRLRGLKIVGIRPSLVESKSETSLERLLLSSVGPDGACLVCGNATKLWTCVTFFGNFRKGFLSFRDRNSFLRL